MIDFDFSKECYSCSACKYICPKDAISYDEKLHPTIYSDLCIDCGLCENNCIKMREHNYEERINSNSSYIARNKDDDFRNRSSSGGIFILLAQKVLEDGGAVCGCVFDENFLPHHVVTYDIETTMKMMGSKYVMSDMENCIDIISKEIKKGKKVLFSGVPCQIEALLSSIPDCRNLILVAVVCHGSISRDVWMRYLLEECGNKKIKSISMRDKSHGWLNYGLKIQYEDGTESISYRKEDGYFLKCFTDGILERERCLSCRYKGTNIRADILLGDGWGIENVFPEMVDTLGVSSVICLTKKGDILVEAISEKMERKEIRVESIIERNARIVSPPTENPLREIFLMEMRRKDTNIHKLCKKYANPPLIYKVYSKIIKAIK